MQLADPRTALLSTGRGSEQRLAASGPTSATWHAAVAIAAGLAFGLVLVVQGVPTAWRSPTLAVATHTLAMTVALALLQLGVARYLGLGNLLDLSAGLAFGVLAVSNSVVLALLLLGAGPTATSISTAFVLVARAVSTSLLFLGVFRSPGVVPLTHRASYGFRFVAIVAGVVGLAMALLIPLSGLSTPLVDSQARVLLQRGDVVQDALPGQSPSLLLVGGLITLGLAASAVRSSWLSRRLGDRQVGWLTIALILFAFGAALELLFPPIVPNYVSFGDLFRMAGFAVLLVSLAVSLSRAAAENALNDERLRLSRDLHDGLAQELSLMHFHLAAAIQEQRQMDVPALEKLEEQVERALLEARQAIGSLRASLISWESFVAAVETYCVEFEQNHGLAVHLDQEGWGTIDIVLQSEILRVLSEAFSNALRHGRATKATVSVSRAGDWLQLRVTDDGVGLPGDAPSLGPGEGVGLASMRERVKRRGGSLTIGCAPAGGTVLAARVPIAPREVR